jgi:site-specific recombinase XerD
MLLEIQKEFLEHLTRTRAHKYGQKRYMEIFNEYLSGAGLDIFNLKVKQARDFQSYLMTLTGPDGSIHYTKGTVSMAITGMRNFYDFLKKRGLAFSNPFLAVRKVKRGVQLLKDIPDEEAVHRFLKRLTEFWKIPAKAGRASVAKYYRAHVVAELIYSTGLYMGDIMRLRVKDVDFRRSVVKLDGGTTSEREYLLNDYARQVLEIYVERMREVILPSSTLSGTDGSLFGNGKNLRDSVNAVFREISSQEILSQEVSPQEAFSPQGREFTAKGLRHAMALHLLRNGCSIRHAQEILGYRDIKSMRAYRALDREGLKNVIDRYHPRASKGGQA